MNLGWVREDAGQVGAELEFKNRLAAHRGLEQFPDFQHLGGEISSLDVELSLARVGEQLPRQMGGHFCALNDFAEVLLGAIAGRQFVTRGAGVAHDSGQEIIEIVGDAARQNI